MTIQGWLIVAGVFSVSLVIALEVLMQRYYDQPMIDVESRHAPSATKASGEDILGRLRACETCPLTTMTEECKAVVRDPALWPEDEIAIEAAWERTGLNPTWPEDEAGCGVKYATAMADEIEFLRLTDEERAAVEYFADIHADDDPPHEYAATLRSLLSRLS